MGSTGKTQEELILLLETYRRSLEVEKRYHVTLDNMMEGFQMISFDWHYLYVNNAAVKQSHYSREDLIGHTMMEKYPGIEKSAMFKVLEECMDKRSAHHIENEFIFPDKSKGWFELSIQPAQEGLFILSMDITDRKKIEHDREQHINELQSILFKISHEVRTPIVQILGVANVLDQTKVSQKELQIVAQCMKESAELLDTYTRELTRFVTSMRMNLKN